MARAPKSANNIQVFRGSRPKADVFTSNAGIGCCAPVDFSYDKLGERVRFDNGLKHLSPTGGVERYRFPSNPGFDDRAAIIAHINAVGVGAEISVIAIPTYAFLTGLGIHVEAEEEGLVFEVATRNGLALPTSSYIVTAVVDENSPCGVTRTLVYTAPADGVDVDTDPDSLPVTGIGPLADGVLFKDYFYRSGAACSRSKRTRSSCASLRCRRPRWSGCST